MASDLCRKEVKTITEVILSLLISILGSIVGYYICKWWDGD